MKLPPRQRAIPAEYQQQLDKLLDDFVRKCEAEVDYSGIQPREWLILTTRRETRSPGIRLVKTGRSMADVLADKKRRGVR